MCFGFVGWLGIVGCGRIRKRRVAGRAETTTVRNLILAVGAVHRRSTSSAKIQIISTIIYFKFMRDSCEGGVKKMHSKWRNPLIAAVILLIVVLSNNPGPVRAHPVPQENWVWSVEWSPDGTKLAVGRRYDSVTVYSD